MVALRLFLILLDDEDDDDDDDDDKKANPSQESHLLIYFFHSIIEFKVFPSISKIFIQLIPNPLQLRHPDDPYDPDPKGPESSHYLWQI